MGTGKWAEQGIVGKYEAVWEALEMRLRKAFQEKKEAGKEEYIVQTELINLTGCGHHHIRVFETRGVLRRERVHHNLHRLYLNGEEGGSLPSSPENPPLKENQGEEKDRSHILSFLIGMVKTLSEERDRLRKEVESALYYKEMAESAYEGAVTTYTDKQKTIVDLCEIISEISGVPLPSGVRE